MLPRGALSTQAVGLQTRSRCFLQILQPGFDDDGEGRDGCCLSTLRCFLCGQGERNLDECSQAGEDMREEVLFELSFGGG